MHLNLVQERLRNIAVIVDQDDDFKEEVKLSDALDDDLREMGWLFEDLRGMAYDLITLPDEPADKAWFKAHKAQRKADEKAAQVAHKTKIAEEREASKAALKVARMTIAEGDDEPMA